MNGRTSDLAEKSKQLVILVLFILLALLFGTYARFAFLFIYPFLVIALFLLFKWRLDKNLFYLGVLTIFCWLLSFRNGFNLEYHLVSFYFFIPFLLLLFAVPTASRSQRNYLKIFMTCLSIVAVINNFVGITQYIAFPNDDSFSGIYGRFTVSQNGLSIINSVLFFYYLSIYQKNKKLFSLVFAIFFIICSVMGFYGAGLLVFIAAVSLTFFRIRLYNIIQMTLLMFVILFIIVLLMKLVSPDTLEYNLNIIRLFLHSSGRALPRKLVVFQNYFRGYGHSPMDLIFGSGPGTFNSRSAFMVGSPTYFNINFIKSHHQPFFFREYAYPLWNASNTGPYDGFMNQPFTSLLALLGEYGLLITGGMFYALYNQFRNFVRKTMAFRNDPNISVETKMFKFCQIFVLLLIIIDNYMEYPEIIALLLIIAKLSQQQVKSFMRMDGAQQVSH